MIGLLLNAFFPHFLWVALVFTGFADQGWAEPASPAATASSPKLELFTFGFQRDPAMDGSDAYRETVSWVAASAQSGNALSQCLYGVLHHLGLGVPQNDQEAFRWFLSSAEHHRRAASYNVAVCYWKGKGVARNPEEAIRWFQDSAREGFLPAKKALEQIQKGGSTTSLPLPSQISKEAAVASPEPAWDLEKSFQGHTYRFVAQKRSWHVAKESAERAGGHLVVIESPKENAFVADLVSQACGGAPQETWIGLSNDNEAGQWTWVAGKKLKYTNWNTGEPNNTGGIENFAQLGKPTLTDSAEMGKWNDMNAGWKSYYVIEFDRP